MLIYFFVLTDVLCGNNNDKKMMIISRDMAINNNVSRNYKLFML